MIKIIEKNCDDLIPYENNARINEKAVDIVANSIKEFGFKNPIIIDKDNVIVAGHILWGCINEFIRYCKARNNVGLNNLSTKEEKPCQRAKNGSKGGVYGS